jgi:hypothetical protein
MVQMIKYLLVQRYSKFHGRINKIFPLFPILCHLNLLYILTKPSVSKYVLIISSYLCLDLPSSLIPCHFPIKILRSFSNSIMRVIFAFPNSNMRKVQIVATIMEHSVTYLNTVLYKWIKNSPTGIISNISKPQSLISRRRTKDLQQNVH